MTGTGGYVPTGTTAYNQPMAMGASTYNQPVTTPIVWVDNEMYARNAYVAPGTTAFFMERQNQRFYVKSTTLSGEIASFKIFEFNEVMPAPPSTPDSSQFVTVDAFNKSIDELKQLLGAKKKSLDLSI